MNDQHLTVLLMGTPEVKRGEQDIHIQRKLPRALLYYLAGHNQPINRDDLSLLLWPDDAPSDGRRHLREILSKLRAELPIPDVIMTDRDLVSLDAGHISVDLLEFQSILNENRRTAGLVPHNEPLPVSIFHSLHRAVELWRGPHLLAGFDWPESESYDQWVNEANRLVDVSYQFCLLRLADHASASGDLEGASRWLQKAANQDPYNSDLHYRILTTLLEIGRQSEIASYCNYLKELYVKEGGLPASITQLCAKLQSPVKSPLQSRIQWPPVVTLRVPMVGRVDEMNRLRKAYVRGGSAVIFGEAGAGKTRLAYEFYRQEDPLPRLMLLNCQENERSLPFQTLISSLRQCVQPDEWQYLATPWRAQIANLLPELSALFPELHHFPSSQVEDARPHIFEAYFQLMMLLAKNQRIIFILEDAQWCDGSTLSAVEYLLGRGFFHSPNFLIINSRLEALNLDLVEFLDHPRRGVPNEKINLPLLEPEDILEISHSILGERLPDGILQRLKLDTGGNPLYVIEWLKTRLLHLTIQPGQDPNSIEPTIGGLVSLIRDRLNILSPISRQVLAAAAVLGNQFTPAQVEIVAALPAEHITNALEELEKLNLIRPFANDGVYSFIHDKIREVLLMDLSLARRRMLHLRAARMLQDEFSGEQNPNSARIASHYEAGGEPGPAVHAWVGAARYALLMFSPREAEEAFQRADNLVKNYGRNLPDETILLLYKTWGFLTNQATNLKEALRIFSSLLHVGEQRHNRIMMGVAQTGLAQYYHQVGQMEAALKAANQSVLLLDTLPDLQERVNAIYTRGSIFTILAQFDAARRDLETVISLTVNAVESPIIQIRSLSESLLAIIFTMMGLPIRAEEVARGAYQDAQLIQAAFSESNALVSLAMATFYQFKYSESNQLVEEGLKVSEPQQFWHNIGYLHLFRGLIMLSRGYLDQCWNELQTIHSIAVDHRCEDLLASEWQLRGQIHRFLWNFPAALECLQQGESVAYGGQDRLELIVQQAIVLGSAGQYEASAKLFDVALTHSKAAGLGLVYYPALTARLGALALALPAQQLLSEAEAILQEIKDCEIYDVHEFIKYGLAIAHLKAGNLEQTISIAASFNQYVMTAETPWLKVINFVLQKIITSATGQPVDEAVRQSLLTTLQFLDAQVQHPDLRPDFEDFQAILLNQLT
jgi:DNA-binding SARP family transcriptional activator/tetratricopeptide (TPR) repeat protein